MTRHLGKRETRNFHRTLPPKHRSKEMSLPARPSVNIYSIEQNDQHCEQPSYVSGDCVSFSMTPAGFYEREEENEDGGCSQLTLSWVQPSRRPPEPTHKSVQSTGCRIQSASVLLAHRSELSEFKSDVRAVRLLENFKLPRSEFRV